MVGRSVRARRWRRAQALLEFALICPLLVLILGVIVDFGLAMYTAIDVTKLAQDAGQSAARRSLTDAEATSLVEALAQQYGLALSRLTMSVSRPTIEGTQALRLDVKYRFQPISPGVHSATNAGIDLKAVAVYAIGS